MTLTTLTIAQRLLLTAALRIAGIKYGEDAIENDGALSSKYADQSSYCVEMADLIDSCESVAIEI